jgi:ketosteroid isomerase-like protein
MRHVILRPPPHLTLFTDERICLPSSVLPLKGERDPMSELDDFLTKTLARQVEADEALLNGDPTPRLEMWSTQDPVTVFGALKSVSGWDEVSRAFRWIGSRFSDCTAHRFELVAAGVSSDLAYTVGFEHTSVSMDGVPVEPFTLRVTHVYRRENGEWKIVHRHADYPPIDQSPPAAAATT